MEHNTTFSKWPLSFTYKAGYDLTIGPTLFLMGYNLLFQRAPVTTPTRSLKQRESGMELTRGATSGATTTPA